MSRKAKPKVEEEREPVPLTPEEQNYVKEWTAHPMRKPRVAKVSVNFAVGASGPELERARELCERITNQVPADGKAKESVRGFAIRKHEPIAVFTTLRGELAEEFLKKSFWALEDRISHRKFDSLGNLSFGISDHLTLPDIKYDPKIGVLGLQVCVTLEKPGYRIKKRRLCKKRIPLKHQISREEAMTFMQKTFNVHVGEEE